MSAGSASSIAMHAIKRKKGICCFWEMGVPLIHLSGLVLSVSCVFYAIHTAIISGPTSLPHCEPTTVHNAIRFTVFTYHYSTATRPLELLVHFPQTTDGPLTSTTECVTAAITVATLGQYRCWHSQRLWARKDFDGTFLRALLAIISKIFGYRNKTFVYYENFSLCWCFLLIQAHDLVKQLEASMEVHTPTLRAQGSPSLLLPSPHSLTLSPSNVLRIWSTFAALFSSSLFSLFQLLFVFCRS